MGSCNSGGKGGGGATIVIDPNKRIPDGLQPRSEADELIDYLTKTHTVAHSPELALSRTNPNFKGRAGDPYSINCQRCAVAYELQRRGYDVEALGNFGRQDGHSSYAGILKNFGLKDGDDVRCGGWEGWEGWRKATSPTKAVSNVHDAMESWGNGSRGALVLTRAMGSGHIVNLEFINGKVHLNDGQTGKSFVGKKAVREYLTNQRTDFSNLRIFRTDNATLRTEALPELVKMRGK